MSEKEFNLLHQRWVTVMKPDGATEPISLLDLFRNAPKWQGLAGELPTQDMAVLRLLLAILHAVFGRYDPDGTFAPLSSPAAALNRWQTLWGGHTFPMGIIEDYLRRYEDRFWLFHPERPFYQVAGLVKGAKTTEDAEATETTGPPECIEAAKGKKSKKSTTTDYTAAKLNGEISESNNKIRLFPQRTGSSKSALCYSEAARWLLYVNSFDDASGKQKEKEKGLPTRPSGTGWLGKLGLITAVGDNLFETLLLNLIFLKDGGSELWGGEKPIWEAETVKADERTKITMPGNPSELLTLQSRRLLLKREGNSVVGYALLGGDFFPEINAFAEQMTVWRNAAKKETDLPEYHPRRHDPTRQFWRDFSALISQSEGKHRPGVVSWLALLKGKKLIPLSHFRFQIAAVEYNKNSSVKDLFSDSISFNAGLLTALGADWVNRILGEIETADMLAKQAGRLAQDIAKAVGDNDGYTQRDAAEAQAYFRMDAPFRKWLEEINPERDEMNDICNQWWEQASRIVWGLGRELVEQCGPQAISGRVVEDKNKKKVRHNTPLAYNLFQQSTSTREKLKGGQRQ
jgi:CRISPR system Cascade subunit CasA